MKTKIILLLLLSAIILGSCIEEFGGTGEPFNRQEQIVGTWVVTKMVQEDLLTDNPQNSTYDITNIYEFDQYKIDLKQDGTFTTTNPGAAPEFIFSSGTWVLDDPKFPSQINLTSGQTTASLEFGSLNSLTETNELQVVFSRKLLFEVDGGEQEERTAISYNYSLTRSN